MKTLGDFIAEMRTRNEGIFKPTNGNKSMLEISNDNGARVANFSAPEDLIVSS
jgi:hypothetical protein